MAVLSTTFSELYAAVLRLSYDVEIAGASATEIAAAKRIANSAYREFLTANDWTFLTPQTTIQLWLTTTTAAVTVSGAGNTTLTVAADTFYESMLGRSIVADTSGNSYTIVGYTSRKVVTVDSDASADTGDTFTITSNGDYGLPDDFGHLVGHVTYGADEDVAYRPLERTTAGRISQLRAGESDASGDPLTYCLVPRTISSTLGARWDLQVWPTPSQARALTYRYSVQAQEMTADAEYPVGGPAHGETLITFAKARAEKEAGGSSGVWSQERDRALAASIRRDNMLRNNNLGENTDDSDGPVATNRIMGEWTYS